MEKPSLVSPQTVALEKPNPSLERWNQLNIETRWAIGAAVTLLASVGIPAAIRFVADNAETAINAIKALP